MYIERFVEKEFSEWKRTNRDHANKLALEIIGCRQVGKTETVKHFAKENYRNVIYVDVNTERYLSLLEAADASCVLDNVNEFCKRKNLKYTNNQDTVIIFDEVQESKRLFESIRLFNRQLSCDLIVTGSNFQKTIGLFQPAGDLKEIQMFPLSFEEILNYYGAYEYYNDNSIKTICAEKLDWFQKVYDVYCIVGGYPFVFQEYLFDRSVDEAFSSVLKAFKSEFRVNSGDPADYYKIETMFYCICTVLCKEKRGSLE